MITAETEITARIAEELRESRMYTYNSIDHILRYNPSVELSITRTMVPWRNAGPGALKHEYQLSLYIPKIMIPRDGFFYRSSAHGLSEAYAEFTKRVLDQINTDPVVGYIRNGVEGFLEKKASWIAESKVKAREAAYGVYGEYDTPDNNVIIEDED
jgi:hypothetical protein